MKKPLPPEYASSYIVTVSGLPVMGGPRGGQRPDGGQKQERFQPPPPGGPGQPGGDPEQRRQAMVARLKEASTLTVKGKDPVTADGADMVPAQQRQVIVLRFSRQALNLTVADKEVAFATRIGPLEVKAKFVLKDMLYQGKLEL
jgi:hypothetical protein